jgi:hypothetical protein
LFFLTPTIIPDPITNGNPYFPLDIREGVTYTYVVENKTPINALTLTGAVQIRAIEATQTVQVHYLASGSRNQGRLRRDLPFLPDRS